MATSVKEDHSEELNLELTLCSAHILESFLFVATDWGEDDLSVSLRIQQKAVEKKYTVQI